MGVPQVSVVMPVRDGGHFLKAAVSSVLDQDLRDLELIVVDDGSTDGGPAYLARSAEQDPRLRVLTTGPRGYVHALRDGCAAARSELIARMDADDVSLPQRLSAQVTAMLADPRLVLLGTGVRYVDDQDRLLHTRMLPVEDDDLRRALLRSNPFTHSAVVMRREAYEAVGGYRALLRPAEDRDLWFRLSEVGRIGNLPEALVLYRIHDKQVTITESRHSALASLVSVVAAERRSTGHMDPLQDVERLDESLLDHLGVPRSALEEQELDILLWYAPKATGAQASLLWRRAWQRAGATSHPLAARARVARLRLPVVRRAEALTRRVLAKARRMAGARER